MVQREQDWLMRQIQMLVQFISNLIFNNAPMSYEMNEEQTSEVGELYNKLEELLLTGNICAAENALHESFSESEDYLRLAMWFYSEINKMTDEELKTSNFSREEIYEGLRDVVCKRGISLPTIL